MRNRRCRWALSIVLLLAGCASPTTLALHAADDGGRYIAPAPVIATGCSSTNGLPDARCTPGATDPRVTQANIASTICVSGYTAKVRPPTSVTTPIKRERVVAYGDRGPLSQYELDHLIPLELGGAPRSVANLWPEPWNGADGAHGKDVVENALHRAVCNGTMPLAVAQRAIASNWRTAQTSKVGAS